MRLYQENTIFRNISMVMLNRCLRTGGSLLDWRIDEIMYSSRLWHISVFSVQYRDCYVPYVSLYLEMDTLWEFGNDK